MFSVLNIRVFFQDSDLLIIIQYKLLITVTLKIRNVCILNANRSSDQLFSKMSYSQITKPRAMSMGKGGKTNSTG